MNNRRRITASIGLLTLCWVCSGCDSSPYKARSERGAGQATDRDADPIISRVERGEAQLTVTFSPPAPRLSDQPQLVLRAETKRGVRVELPPFGSSIGDFSILDFHEPLPVARDDKMIFEQVYTLEPTRVGELIIDPLFVSFSSQGSSGSATEFTIASEPLTINVATMLANQAPSLTDLRPPAAPATMPAEDHGRWVWVVAGVAAVALAMLAAVAFHHRRTSQPAPLSALELAQRELQSLAARDLAKANIKLFYVELTGIVRRFIERSTGIHAPEQTTEEFLREISTPLQKPTRSARLASQSSLVDDALSSSGQEPGQSVFSAELQHRLGEFLRAADLVKFAGRQPTAAEVDESLNRARDLIKLEPPLATEESA